MILYTDFENVFNVKSDRILGVIPVSGVFDLTPLLKTDVNDNVKMSFEDAHKASPLLRQTTNISNLRKNNIKILIAYGEDESVAFKQQSIDYSNVRIFLY